MTTTLIALLACASVNNGNPSSTGSPRDVSYGDLFASDEGGGGGGGGSGVGSDDSGTGDTGAWDTGSWDTGGGGGGGADGEYPGSLSIAFVSSEMEFGCEGTAVFVVSDGSFYGYGACDTDFGDTVNLAWGAGLVQVAYPDYECAVTDTSFVDGDIASGETLGFGGTWDMEPCGAPAFYEFEGTVAFD